jgi:hypothetical protein
MCQVSDEHLLILVSVTVIILGILSVHSLAYELPAIVFHGVILE